MTTNTISATAFLASDDEESDPNEYFSMTAAEDIAFFAFEEMLMDDTSVDEFHYELLDGVDPDPAVRVYRVSDYDLGTSLAILYIA